MMTPEEFVRESNRIEGILRDPTQKEIGAFGAFMAFDEIQVSDLVDFVKVMQPDAVLRDNPTIPGVRVGSHIAPPSGPNIRRSLESILTDANIFHGEQRKTFRAHMEYETLHPFTDGNGRSGRMLWAWMMGRDAALSLGFLHRWYYQSLEFGR